jgi:hypothetical protein
MLFFVKTCVSKILLIQHCAKSSICMNVFGIIVHNRFKTADRTIKWKMKKIYFIIAVGIVVGCATKKCVNSDNLYKIALQKIILEYAADIKNIESSIISNEQIPFNLESTYSGIIERNLIANYDEMMDCDTIQIKHINKLIDSLAA